jgi:hypothetical protein
MSIHEKSAWWALATALLIWAYLTMRMTDGWQVVELPPRIAISTYVTVVIMSIVAASAPAILWPASKGDGPEMDERDRAIDAAGDRWEGYVVIAVVNVLVIQVLASSAYADRVPSVALPDLRSTTTLVFLLISALFAAHVAKQLVIIWHYRR